MICQNTKIFSHSLNYRHFVCHIIKFTKFNQDNSLEIYRFFLILRCEKSRFVKQPVSWFVDFLCCFKVVSLPTTTHQKINKISLIFAHSSLQKCTNFRDNILLFSLLFFFFFLLPSHVTEATLDETWWLSLILVAQPWNFLETLRSITINNNSVENVFYRFIA